MNKNKNGWQVGAENLRKFQDWIAEHTAANDWHLYSNGRKLNKTEIAKECNFGTPVFRQNPQVKAAIEDLETHLRSQGALGDVEEKTADQRYFKESNVKESLIK